MGTTVVDRPLRLFFSSGESLEMLDGNNRDPWREKQHRHIEATYGTLYEVLKGETVWTNASLRKATHRYIEAGAAGDIAALFYVRVGESCGEAERREVKSFIQRAKVVDYPTVYRIVLNFVFGEMVAIKARQEQAKAAEAVEERWQRGQAGIERVAEAVERARHTGSRVAEIKGQDGAVIRTIEIHDDHPNGNRAA